MLQHIYSRNGILYIQTKRENKRVRLSTGLKDCALSAEFIAANFELFINNKAKALQEFYKLHHKQQKNILQKQDFHRNHNEFEHLINALLKEKQMLKFNTFIGYQSVFDDILQFLKDKRIERLKDFQRQDSLDFVAYLRAKNNQSSTIKVKITIFKHLFKYALELDLINKNPFYTPKLSKNEQELDNEKKKPFDLDQIKRLIQESSGELRSYLTIAFFTGLRTGELLGLRKDDLDLNECKAHIKRTLLRDNKTTNTPKTMSSCRTIDLLPIVVKELHKMSKRAGAGFLFQSRRDDLRNQFYELQERLDIEPRRRLYDTRHSFASVMLSKGEEPMWISRVMLGHSNLNQTFKTYAQYLPKSVKERAAFLNDIEW